MFKKKLISKMTLSKLLIQPIKGHRAQAWRELGNYDYNGN